MLKTGLVTALTATTAIAQPVTHPTPPPPPRVVQHTIQRSPEYVAAGEAYNRCLLAAANALPATLSPEANAAQSVASCTQQRSALTAAFEAWVSSRTFPASARAGQRAEFTQQLAGIQAQLAAAVARARSGRPAAPAPPAPPAPPHG